MTRLIERRRAIRLRKQGKSYGEIRAIMGNISKGSLSLWLREMPLTEKQLLGLKKIRQRAVEKYRQTMKLKRQKRNEGYYQDQKKKWLPFSKREEYIAGLFLYWGEGNKASRNIINITNTDPKVVKFALYWFVKCLGFPKDRIKATLHLYKDMNVEKEIEFWSNQLKFLRSQFNKPYIKDSKRMGLDQKSFGHGTCSISVSDTIVKENILMALQAIPDHFGEKITRI